jgi:hypothetical protein
MSEKSKSPNDAKAKLSKENATVIGELAAILALASIKAATAERQLFGDAFNRSLEWATKVWGKKYSYASAEEKKEIEDASNSIIKKLREFVADTHLCCVGGTGGNDEDTCIRNGGEWACMPPPPHLEP